MNRYPNAAEGLKLMFYGEIVAIIGAFLGIIPLLGGLLALAGGVVSLVGLNKAGADDEGYRTAFMLTIINIIVSLVSSFAGDGVFGTLVGIVSSVLSLAVIYFVCITTANLLHSVGASELERKGNTVWTINLVCTIVSVAVMLLAYIPIVNILAAVVGVISALVALVGYIMYLMFLNGSYKVL